MTVLVFGVVLRDLVEFGCDFAEGADGGAGDGSGGEGGGADGTSGLSDNVGAEHCVCMWVVCVWVCSKKSTVLDGRRGVVLGCRMQMRSSRTTELHQSAAARTNAS